MRPKGASLTLAAELRGLTAFRTPHHIAGILLNDCTQGLCALLKPMLEKETGLPSEAPRILRVALKTQEGEIFC